MVLGEEAPATGHEDDQQVERLWREGDNRPVARQDPGLRIEPKLAEAVRTAPIHNHALMTSIRCTRAARCGDPAKPRPGAPLSADLAARGALSSAFSQEAVELVNEHQISLFARDAGVQNPLTVGGYGK